MDARIVEYYRVLGQELDERSILGDQEHFMSIHVPELHTHKYASKPQRVFDDIVLEQDAKKPKTRTDFYQTQGPPAYQERLRKRKLEASVRSSKNNRSDGLIISHDASSKLQVVSISTSVGYRSKSKLETLDNSSTQEKPAKQVSKLVKSGHQALRESSTSAFRPTPPWNVSRAHNVS